MNDNLFSYYTNGITQIEPKDNSMTIDRLAKGIKTQFKTSTDSLRLYLQQGDKEQAEKAKRGLDYVTFSGTFSKRGAKNIVTSSGLIVIDLDDLPDVVEAKKTILEQTDIDIAMMFVSPSGKGLKVVVPSTTEMEHLQVFRMYQRYFKSIGFDVDESGKDIGRACFVCHDPDVYHSDTFEFKKLPDYWDEPIEPTQPQPQTHTTHSHNTDAGGYEADDLDEVTKVANQIKVKGLNIAPDYNSYLDVGFALATLGEAGRSVYHSVCSVSEKYNYDDTDRKFTECLNSGNGSIGLGTFFQMAKDVGIEFLGINAVDEKRFYVFDRKGNVKIRASVLSKWLQRAGFMRIRIVGDDRIFIINNKTKVFEVFNHASELISYLIDNILPEDKGKELEIMDALIASKTTIDRAWLLLQSVELKHHRDTKDVTHIYAKNGIVRVSKSGIEMLDYTSDEIGICISAKSMMHNYTNTMSDKNNLPNVWAGDFARFFMGAVIGSIKDISECSQDEKDKLIAFCTMIGYLLNDHKVSSESKAIILSDEGADDESRKGGRGKTLITKVLDIFRMCMTRGGNEIDFIYRHVFAGLTPQHSVVIIDDVIAGFRYDLMYTHITGDITVEGKGVTAFTIPEHDAAKFIITTNWAVRHNSEESSTNRRFNEYKITDYWSSKKPVDVFGKEFFSDEWEATDWQCFFEFVIYCSMQFHTHRLQKVEYDKSVDNYRAYFSNDAVEHEMNRIFEKLKEWQEFSYTDFENIHKEQYPYANDRLFNRNTARAYIDAYVSYHKLGFTRGDKRKWEQSSDVFANMKVPDVNGLPF